MIYRCLLTLLLCLSTQFAWSRVFNFDQEFFSTYLAGTGGLSGLNKDAYGSAGGTGTSFEEKVEFNFSGEVGIAITLSRLTIRIGVEGLVPKDQTGAKGKNSGGTELMNVDSEILGIIPTVAGEFIVFQESDSRFLVGVSVGQAKVTLKNTVSLTTTGATQFGISDYVENAEATVIGGSVFAGIESLFTDNVTFTAGVGYRLYQVGELKHTTDVTSVDGSFVTGDKVVNSDGSDRTLNLKGLYAGLGLRFYIGGF